MKKSVFALLFLLLVLTVNAVWAEPMVYVGGSYLDDNGEEKACYWKNGNRHELDGVSVSAITVKDGKVYAAGIYRETFFSGSITTKDICAYWIDNRPYELPDCDYVSNIYLDGNNVYIFGNDENKEKAYWKNGVRQPDLENGHMTALTVVNGVIYITGYTGYLFDDEYPSVAFCWVNGVRKELPGSENFFPMCIEVINGSIYIGATNFRNNAPNKSCYWINDVQQFINSAESAGYVRTFSIPKYKMYYTYFVTQNGCWIEKHHDFTEEAKSNAGNDNTTKRTRNFDDNIYQCTLSGGRIYIAGCEWRFDGPAFYDQTPIACYDVDKTRHYLSGTSAYCIYVEE